MSALEQLRQQGFELKAVDTGLYIDPINELTDTQRRWIVEHKPEIRRQLLVERWHWFLSLSTEHGIHPDVVAASFPSEQDRLDVIEPPEHDDDGLRKCMETLCADPRVRQPQQDYVSGRWIPIDPENEQIL